MGELRDMADDDVPRRSDEKTFVDLAIESGKRRQTESGDVAGTLNARGGKYGRFEDNAKISQTLKDLWRALPGWKKLDPVHREALDMFAIKICRVYNGDPDYDDNWRDMAGYATLALEHCLEKAK